MKQNHFLSALRFSANPKSPQLHHVRKRRKGPCFSGSRRHRLVHWRQVLATAHNVCIYSQYNCEDSANSSEQLRKDGNLRDDIYVHEYDDQPSSWKDIRETMQKVMDPKAAGESQSQLKEDLRHAEIKTDDVIKSGSLNPPTSR